MTTLINNIISYKYITNNENYVIHSVLLWTI